MTKCPNCHKTITDPEYEFGTEFKMRCLSCPCGAHVIVDADPSEVLRKAKKTETMEKSRRRRM